MSRRSTPVRGDRPEHLLEASGGYDGCAPTKVPIRSVT